jgi:hypothetical protein
MSQRREHQRSAEPPIPALRTIYQVADEEGLGGALRELGEYAHLRVEALTEMRLQREVWPATQEDLVFFECDSSGPSSSAGSSAGNVCCICLEKMHTDTAVVTACHHCFHTDCARDSERCHPSLPFGTCGFSSWGQGSILAAPAWRGAARGQRPLSVRSRTWPRRESRPSRRNSCRREGRARTVQ